MRPSRRALLGSAIAAASTLPAGPLNTPTVHRNRRRRVTKEELWSACAEHIRWRHDPSTGRRLNFADQDLSGLEFPEASSHEMPNPDQLDFLCLNGSDFTNADLSFCKGGAIAFASCSFQTATLSHSVFTSPRFANSSLWRAKCDDVEWGTAQDPRHNDTASLTDVACTRATFTGAKLRGVIFRVNFVAANLCNADFSYCIFARTHNSQVGHDTRFGPADLSSARLCYSIIEDAELSRANLDRTNFHSARISPAVKRDIYNNHPQLWPVVQELPYA